VKNFLTSATKRRVIQELRKILYDHPRYREDSDNVQAQYAFTERPQRGIIVSDAGADRVRLSADNYMGRLRSFLMQTKVHPHPGTSLEWVKENNVHLEQLSEKRDIFPSPPGVYIIEITKLPDIGRNVPGEFTVDPVLTVNNEPLIRFSSSTDTEAQISRENIHPGSVRLWLDNRVLLVPNVDYSINESSGAILFLKTPPIDAYVVADYRYQTDQQGPYYFTEESAHFEAIPGAILAFGDRVQLCDKVAVVVGEDRTDVADIFGGKFEVNFNLTVFARGDVKDREKLNDYVTIKFLERQNFLGFEGLELIDISPGGESEEIYNPEIDDYYYDGSISLSMRVDWEILVSLPITFVQAEPVSQEEDQRAGHLDGSYVWDKLNATSDPSQIAGVSTVIGKDIGYERVS
jgi:hypothetical protein